MPRAFAALLFILTAIGVTGAEHPKEYYDADVQHLSAVQTFAFGPVGYDPKISEGERAFAAILQKKESIRYILQVFDHGTPEARCYALVALREMSDALFEKCYEAFRTNPPNGIATMEGPSAVPVPIATMCERIEAGKYRRFFVQHEEEQP